MKMQYAVVFTKMPNNYCGHAPDVPGCFSVGDTLDEMRTMMREALAFHIEELIEMGLPVPEPTLSLDDVVALPREPQAGLLEPHAEYGSAPPPLSTTCELVEVEIPVPNPA